MREGYLEKEVHAVEEAGWMGRGTGVGGRGTRGKDDGSKGDSCHLANQPMSWMYCMSSVNSLMPFGFWRQAWSSSGA
eukprot:4644103-Pyramimonas_sp.AAC.2